MREKIGHGILRFTTETEMHTCLVGIQDSSTDNYRTFLKILATLSIMTSGSVGTDSAGAMGVGGPGCEESESLYTEYSIYHYVLHFATTCISVR